MSKSKNKKTSNLIIFFIIKSFIVIFILSILTMIYSCEKKEPAKQPTPDEIMQKISEYFPDEIKLTKLYESDITELYSKNKSNPPDLSKIEKYSLIAASSNSAVEIGIFKLYDKINANYVKQMAQTRISKLQSDSFYNNKNINLKKILNNAEIRSYGNYVYYVSHSKKDKIFEIIENTLRGV